MIIKVDYRISGGGVDCDQSTFLESNDTDPDKVIAEYFKDMWGPETQYVAEEKTYHSDDFSTGLKIKNQTVIDEQDVAVIRRYFSVIITNI
jgi:hypothetical protein